MKQIAFEFANVQIEEIKIENGDVVKVKIRLSLLDSNGDYVGSVFLDSGKAASCDFCISQPVAEAVANLFLTVEKDITEREAIEF